jgi:hypothetical protein
MLVEHINNKPLSSYFGHKSQVLVRRMRKGWKEERQCLPEFIEFGSGRMKVQNNKL